MISPRLAVFVGLGPMLTDLSVDTFLMLMLSMLELSMPRVQSAKSLIPRLPTPRFFANEVSLSFKPGKLTRMLMPTLVWSDGPLGVKWRPRVHV